MISTSVARILSEDSRIKLSVGRKKQLQSRKLDPELMKRLSICGAYFLSKNLTDQN